MTDKITALKSFGEIFASQSSVDILLKVSEGPNDENGHLHELQWLFLILSRPILTIILALFSLLSFHFITFSIRSSLFSSESADFSKICRTF
jgi:hypothetical protein